MKNSSDTFGDRTRDLSACSAVPQPTAPRRASLSSHWRLHNAHRPVCEASDSYSLKTVEELGINPLTPN